LFLEGGNKEELLIIVATFMDDDESNIHCFSFKKKLEFMTNKDDDALLTN
jgi:hypothetical protein